MRNKVNEEFEEGDLVRHHWDHVYNQWRKHGIIIGLSDQGWAVVEWSDGDVHSCHIDDLDRLTILDRLAEL